MKSLRIFLSAMLALIALGCTHNDGDIGPWFGTWAMPGMTVDGVTPEGFDPTATVWQFQSEIVAIRRLGDHHTLDATCWGTWHEADGHLYLNYTHSQTQQPGQYDAPAWLMMENHAVTDLTVVERGKRSMVLSQTTPDGKHITYTLKKTW